MPKNDNAHALRLKEAIQLTAGEEEANRFAEKYPLSKSADISKKHQWACDICTALQEHFPCEAASIRRACHCGDGKTMAHEMMACFQKAESLALGCELFSEMNQYAFLEYISDHELIFGYHACVCSCIKRAEGPIPLLFCECSAGYAEAMFQQVFGDAVQVTLLDSVKNGAERCIFRIHW